MGESITETVNTVIDDEYLLHMQSRNDAISSLLYILIPNDCMKHDSSAPETQATKFLKKNSIAYSTYLYAYEEHGGTKVSARELNVPEHSVVKTLAMEDDAGQPFLVLMHGDLQAPWLKLVDRHASTPEKLTTCDPKDVTRHTGYLVGGCSPFGTKKKLMVAMQKTILDLSLIYINGGRRGFLVGVHPHDILRVLQPKIVECGLHS